MAVTATPYGKFLYGLGRGYFNFTTATIKVSLHSATNYTPQISADEFKSNVGGEITGAPGYDAGGVTLSGVTWTHDTTNNRGLLTASPAQWTGLTATARYAVICQWTGDASTSRLIGYIDFGQDKTYNSEEFQLSFPAGLARVRGL